MSAWLERLLSRADEVPQSPLGELSDVEMLGPHVGRLWIGGLETRVTVEPDDWIRISAAASAAVSSAEAMEANSRFPGNLRYAGNARRLQLIADSQLDGRAHLTRSLQEVRAGVAMAAEPTPRIAEKQSAPAHDQLEAVLRQMGWDEERIVRRDGGWELRPRLRGQPQAVQLNLHGASLHVHQSLWPVTAKNRAIVAGEALRRNGQLRLARYAFLANQLVAESWLHAGIVQPHWVTNAVHAVAVAGDYLSRLAPLADCSEVQDWYAGVFGI